MKSIKELLDGKPSRALRAMLDGLQEAETNPNCIIDMNSFGRFRGGKCFGCAATWAVQKLADRLLTPAEVETVGLVPLLGPVARQEYKLETLPFEIEELNEFEDAINDARMGSLEALFIFMGCGDHHSDTYEDWWHMSEAAPWQDSVPAVERMIERLEKQNL